MIIIVIQRHSNSHPISFFRVYGCKVPLTSFSKRERFSNNFFLWDIVRTGHILPILNHNWYCGESFGFQLECIVSYELELESINLRAKARRKVARLAVQYRYASCALTGTIQQSFLPCPCSIQQCLPRMEQTTSSHHAHHHVLSSNRARHPAPIRQPKNARTRTT